MILLRVAKFVPGHMTRLHNLNTLKHLNLTARLQLATSLQMWVQSSGCCGGAPWRGDQVGLCFMSFGRVFLLLSLFEVFYVFAMSVRGHVTIISVAVRLFGARVHVTCLLVVSIFGCFFFWIYVSFLR